jgi:PAS domain S-box-containing protein
VRHGLSILNCRTAVAKMTEPQLSETQKIIVSIPALSGLSWAQLNTVREYVNVRSYPPGRMVFSEGEPGHSLYIVKSGLVEILKKGPDEHAGTIRLARRGPGEIIGEMAVIEEKPRFATAICVVETQLAEMSREDFMRLLATRPDMALQFLKLLIERVKEADITRLKELEEKNEKLETSATRLHQALKKLQVSNEQLEETVRSRQQLLDVSPFPIIVTDADMQVVYSNPATYNVFGLESDECIGHRISDLLKHPDSTKGNRMTELLLREGEPWNGDVELYDKQGHLLYCYVEALPVPTDRPENQTYLFIFHDQTEIRELQQQSFERERLANKGEMAAEIAHELNNYLAVLSGNIELLPMFMENKNFDRITKCLSTLEVSLARMQVFTTALLSSRLPRQEKSQQNINTFIENQVAFLKPQRKFKKIIIITQLDRRLPEFEVDLNAIQQVLYNLILNSAEALASTNNDEPSVTIATRWLPDRGIAEVEISDNGPGIDRKVLAELFHKHITSKPDGHGIGLMTVRKIIEGHKGTISAGISATGGASFIIGLPVAQTVEAGATAALPVRTQR